MTTSPLRVWTYYRVYRAPDGDSVSYCGEFDTLVEASRVAEQEPPGLPEDLWETARKAGHCGGLEAPGYGIEESEPVGWYGSEGWHCVVRVRRED